MHSFTPPQPPATSLPPTISTLRDLAIWKTKELYSNALSDKLKAIDPADRLVKAAAAEKKFATAKWQNDPVGLYGHICHMYGVVPEDLQGIFSARGADSAAPPPVVLPAPQAPAPTTVAPATRSSQEGPAGREHQTQLDAKTQAAYDHFSRDLENFRVFCGTEAGKIERELLTKSEALAAAVESVEKKLTLALAEGGSDDLVRMEVLDELQKMRQLTKIGVGKVEDGESGYEVGAIGCWEDWGRGRFCEKMVVYPKRSLFHKYPVKSRYYPVSLAHEPDGERNISRRIIYSSRPQTRLPAANHRITRTKSPPGARLIARLPHQIPRLFVPPRQALCE